MDWQGAFNIAAGMVGAIMGWLLKTLWLAVDRLRRDLNQLEVSISSNYLKRDDFKESMDRLEAKLDRLAERIFDRLEEKANK